ncbi:MAG TPA: PEP-CTERM sorting domain-containing protein, partial [Chthoniobacteraceae bacterium]|nr:PEP-CTERM sorting domain-containing protein [Chthoniobacteraceae bacterium]
DLQQTHVEVGGDVTLNLTGRVAVTIGGTSAGLRLPETSVLSITALGTDGGDANAGYFMQFTGEGTPEGLLYGLAWEGDQTLKLQSLIDSFAITWTSTLESAPQLFYDEALDTTFIGYAAIPEPGSLSLLLAAGAILGTLAGKKLLRDRRTVS